MKFVPRNSIPQNSFPNTFRSLGGAAPQIPIGTSSGSGKSYPLNIFKRIFTRFNYLSRISQGVVVTPSVLQLESFTNFEMDTVLTFGGEIIAVFPDFTLAGGSQIVGFEVTLPPPASYIALPSELGVALSSLGFNEPANATPVEGSYSEFNPSVFGSTTEEFGKTGWPISCTNALNNRLRLVIYGTPVSVDEAVSFACNSPAIVKIYYV